MRGVAIKHHKLVLIEKGGYLIGAKPIAGGVRVELFDNRGREKLFDMHPVASVVDDNVMHMAMAVGLADFGLHEEFELVPVPPPFDRYSVGGEAFPLKLPA